MKTRAAVLCDMGRARPYAASRPLAVEELELEGPGVGEVLVELAAAGVCHSDLSVVDGSRPRPLPMVLGHEAAGIVREVGEGVRDLRPGDHVVFSFVPTCGRCRHCVAGEPSLCEEGGRANVQGTLLGGAVRFSHPQRGPVHHHLGVSAFSQYTVAARESLIPIPQDIPLEKAALFGCAVITGVGAVLNTARVSAGQSLAVFGLGGVGLSALLGARLVGAWPIVAVDPLRPKLELARTLGATYAIEGGPGNDVVAQIRDLTHGGVDFAFEAVGSAPVIRQAYESTRRGGTVISIGLPHPSHEVTLPALSLVTEAKTVRGSYMGSAVPARDIPRFLELYRAGRLPVDHLISRFVTLDAINEAMDALAGGEAVRQVITF